MIIAVTSRHSREEPMKLYMPETYEQVASVSKVTLVQVQGYLIPENLLSLCSGLILTHSNYIINPVEWGEELGIPTGVDEFVVDRQLVKYFVEHKKPILAIGTGMHALNVVLGGTLRRVLYHTGTLHRIAIEHGSFLENIAFEDWHEVNSHHSYAVGKLAKGLHPVAQAVNSDIVEALENREHNLIGVQWNPEMNEDAADRNSNFYTLLNYFFGLCRKER